MAMIIRATANESSIPEGFPILFNESMQIIVPAFAYLRDVAMISRGTQTVRIYAEHLSDWFDTLEQSAISWDEATRATLAAYRRRHLEQVSPQTGRPYAASTINARLGTVCRFYTWAQQEGLIDQVPFNTIERRRWQRHQSFFPGQDAVNEMSVPVPQKERRELSDEEISHLKATLRQPYRLMADWALLTGMRNMEICGLDVEKIPKIGDLRGPAYKLENIWVSVTKGSNPRYVYPPLWLLDHTRRYIDEVRERLVRARKKRDPSYDPEDAIFLGRLGQPIKPYRMSDAFKVAYRANDIEADVHCLRHTFAIRALRALTKLQQKEQGRGRDINVLSRLRRLLGHVHLSTTETYLKSLVVRPEDIPEGLGYLYGDDID